MKCNECNEPHKREKCEDCGENIPYLEVTTPVGIRHSHDCDCDGCNSYKFHTE